MRGSCSLRTVRTFARYLHALDPACEVRSIELLPAKTKFGKSREVLLHPSAVEALIDYAELRDRLCPNPTAPSFLITTVGTRFARSTIYHSFRIVLERAGITHPIPGRHVRVHDLRHRFAVKTLLGWYRDGGDVASRMPLLSTYLGHVDPAATYWCLSAVPELLALAAERLEQTQGARR